MKSQPANPPITFKTRIIELLRHTPLLQAFSPQQFTILLQHSKTHYLKEGEMLFRQDEPLQEVFICLSGCIKLFHLTADGHEKIINIIPPGQNFAEAMLFTEGNRCHMNAAALKQAEVLGIPAVQFLAFLNESPLLCFNVMGLLSKRIQWLLDEVDRLSLHNATFRLIYFLLETHQHPDYCNIISLDVPKHVIASRLSVRPETLSRILKNLAKQDLIALHDHKIELVDIEGLKTLLSHGI
ncbi:Crp/Fnr family transcriptional regulator [Candidatus Thiothrix sp. Deng01]|uniref:Crp/Fnr family transcriptional regulator n=1 Tax=Candidatus Thiothrix phosphatis TaxID=3112415 RepID=A0ABU6CY56_9GAMM|nr:Crp/Fnr family transcriptional regulator [Candidatus Thiothrix sp. Deng01]MEB4591710.1 Crp/Fnr family transcriptional regulator [Candidatus Thiothrix sp. Deng01]